MHISNQPGLQDWAQFQHTSHEQFLLVEVSSQSNAIRSCTVLETSAFLLLQYQEVGQHTQMQYHLHTKYFNNPETQLTHITFTLNNLLVGTHEEYHSPAPTIPKVVHTFWPTSVLDHVGTYHFSIYHFGTA